MIHIIWKFCLEVGISYPVDTFLEQFALLFNI